MKVALLICALTVVIASPAAAGAPMVRVRVLHFTDRSRTIRLPSGKRVPRSLTTVVRSPATGGERPLIVFAHGFALTPARYAGLLSAWAEAGYVVAAPVFPLENANAPGGPNESDLVNEPADLTFVISKLLAWNERLHLGIDRAHIAVAGQSDGGVAALAVAYDRRFRDPRVRAAAVLSGAASPGMGPFATHGPPLLAVQGTADPINAPANTAAYFRLVHRPKFLLLLLGASHLPPYTDEEPQLRIVERVTTAFFDHYLAGGSLSALDASARTRLTAFTADP